MNRPPQTDAEQTPVAPHAGDLLWNRGRLRRAGIQLLALYPELLCGGAALWITLRLHSGLAEQPAPNPPLQRAWSEFVEGQMTAAETTLTASPGTAASSEGKRLLAEIHYALCRRHFEEADWVRSAAECKRTLGWAAEHEQARQTVRQLIKRAKERFMQGYLLESSKPEAARGLYEEAAALLEPLAALDETAKTYRDRAKARLRNL